jgi:RNA polymerase sigma-70 factor (ECF subfamily)
LTDEDIVDRYNETHNGRYFDMLYNRYGKKVFAKSISLLQDRALAEDATQEIFVKILLNLSKFKGSSKFSTWVYSITYNYCIDYIRKQKKHRVVADESHLVEEPIEEVSDKELLEIKIERLEVIMDNADSKDKAILMMKYMDNMSIKDMSGILNRSESAVKMSILRAKHRVKKIYKEIYHE